MTQYGNPGEAEYKVTISFGDTQPRHEQKHFIFSVSMSHYVFSTADDAFELRLNQFGDFQHDAFDEEGLEDLPGESHSYLVSRIRGKARDLDRIKFVLDVEVSRSGQHNADSCPWHSKVHPCLNSIRDLAKENNKPDNNAFNAASIFRADVTPDVQFLTNGNTIIQTDCFRGK